MDEIRVVIADPDIQVRKSLKSILSQAGHVVVGETDDALVALKLVRSRQPDLVIIEAQMAILDGAELGYIIEEDGLAPVILMTSGEHLKISEQHPFAYVMKPVTEQSLLPLLDAVMKNYKRIRNLEQEVAKLKETIETRKLVEKAKGILMDRYKLTEAEAFKKIQKQSMNKRVSMKSVAKAIILSHEITQ